MAKVRIKVKTDVQGLACCKVEALKIVSGIPGWYNLKSEALAYFGIYLTGGQACETLCFEMVKQHEWDFN